MPDIAMCVNHSCPKAINCLRYKLKPDKDYQTYCDFESDEKNKCFMPIDGKIKKNNRKICTK